MKKLINKFKLLSEDPIASAEECKSVAIEFATYVFNLDTCKYTEDEMFDKFIEEEYEK